MKNTVKYSLLFALSMANNHCLHTSVYGTAIELEATQPANGVTSFQINERTVDAESIVIHGANVTTASAIAAFEWYPSTNDRQITPTELSSVINFSLTNTIGMLTPQFELSRSFTELLTSQDAEQGQLIWRELRAQLPRETLINVDTDNTAITVTNFTASVQAQSTNGEISVETTGNFTLHSTNGSINAQGVGGEVETTNGSVQVVWNGNSLEPLTVTTTNGSVIITTSATSNFRYHLTTTNGRILFRGTTHHDELMGEQGSSSTLLQVNTTNGEIVIN